MHLPDRDQVNDSEKHVNKCVHRKEICSLHPSSEVSLFDYLLDEKSEARSVTEIGALLSISPGPLLAKTFSLLHSIFVAVRSLMRS